MTLATVISLTGWVGLASLVLRRVKVSPRHFELSVSTEEFDADICTEARNNEEAKISWSDKAHGSQRSRMGSRPPKGTRAELIPLAPNVASVKGKTQTPR